MSNIADKFRKILKRLRQETGEIRDQDDGSLPSQAPRIADAASPRSSTASRDRVLENVREVESDDGSLESQKPRVADAASPKSSAASRDRVLENVREVESDDGSLESQKPRVADAASPKSSTASRDRVLENVRKVINAWTVRDKTADSVHLVEPMNACIRVLELYALDSELSTVQQSVQTAMDIVHTKGGEYIAEFNVQPPLYILKLACEKLDTALKESVAVDDAVAAFATACTDTVQLFKDVLETDSHASDAHADDEASAAPVSSGAGASADTDVVDLDEEDSHHGILAEMIEDEHAMTSEDVQYLMADIDAVLQQWSNVYPVYKAKYASLDSARETPFYAAIQLMCTVGQPVLEYGVLVLLTPQRATALHDALHVRAAVRKTRASRETGHHDGECIDVDQALYSLLYVLDVAERDARPFASNVLGKRLMTACKHMREAATGRYAQGILQAVQFMVSCVQDALPNVYAVEHAALSQDSTDEDIDAESSVDSDATANDGSSVRSGASSESVIIASDSTRETEPRKSSDDAPDDAMDLPGSKVGDAYASSSSGSDAIPLPPKLAEARLRRKIVNQALRDAAQAVHAEARAQVGSTRTEVGTDTVVTRKQPLAAAILDHAVAAYRSVSESTLRDKLRGVVKKHKTRQSSAKEVTVPLRVRARGPAYKPCQSIAFPTHTVAPRVLMPAKGTAVPKLTVATIRKQLVEHMQKCRAAMQSHLYSVNKRIRGRVTKKTRARSTKTTDAWYATNIDGWVEDLTRVYGAVMANLPPGTPPAHVLWHELLDPAAVQAVLSQAPSDNAPYGAPGT